MTCIILNWFLIRQAVFPAAFWVISVVSVEVARLGPSCVPRLSSSPHRSGLLRVSILTLLFCSLFPVTFTTVACIVFFLQFSSVAQSCPTLRDPMNRSTRGLPVHHQLPEFTQTHVHRVSDAIQPSHLLSSLSPPAPNPSQHQGLFQ